MIVRKLKKEERFAGHLISAYCFHVRNDNIEAEREKVEAEQSETWGAFAEDGTLAARITNHYFDFYIDGTPVRSGGIGGVATLPEYRNTGAIREIFKPLLQEGYRNGQVISTLYPFNHGFYRKQGYDTVLYRNRYELTPDLLEVYKTDCTVKMWQPGDGVEEYLALYKRFAVQFNLTMLRDEEKMREHIAVDSLFGERQFSYLLSREGKAVAYVIFKDIRTDAGPLLQVQEAVWDGRVGFEAILSFLGRFDADYKKLELQLPYGIDLLRILRTRRAYNVVKTVRSEYMVRVINAQKLLEVIKKPAGCCFTVALRDDIIPQNNGVFRVTDKGVELLPENACAAPDLEIAAPSFAQLAVGAVSLEEAELKPDVQVNGNRETLAAVFTEKKILINDGF